LAHHNRVGTHDIFMAEVQDVHLGSLAPPLTYANRAYGQPMPLPATSS
jgi:flavin reductase (DIM6/NTAB) family NADH-FMN oxidoreductase RutF